ncbi:MAG TPA: hypothetical protein VM097_10890 [Mycobacteriales bacterium]|nr:hypothetical protein [Mycobacteriales bacterium]
MSDFPAVAPPPDGLRQAMAAARGRRLRSAGLTSATAGSALVAVLALLGGTGTQSLVQQPAPEQPAVTNLVPGPEGERTGTENTVGAVTSTGGRPRQGVDSRSRSGAATLALGTTDTIRERSLTSGTSSKPYAAGPLTRDDNGFYVPMGAECNVTGKPEDATTLCPYAQATPQPTPTHFNLYGEVCSTRTNRTTLHYEGRNEVDMAVYQGSTLLWRWSRWHPDSPAPHTFDLATGACSSWTYAWTGVDAEGRTLPKGDYTLEVTHFAEELAGRNRTRAAFTIS